MHIAGRAANAALLFSLLSATSALAAVDPGDIPLAPGEQAARNCYMHAMDGWNSLMAQNPNDRTRLHASYMSFANCARVSIETGHVMRNGQRMPWRTEYLASTIGATYAQVRLATVTSGKSQCAHYALARDLAQQAMTSETETGIPNPNWEDEWNVMLGALKQGAVACAPSVARR